MGYHEIEMHIKALSWEDKKFLAEHLLPSEITAFFENMKVHIAEEAKLRTQNYIASTFNKGYATGALFSSIYYTIDGDVIGINSTKNYFFILNNGYGGFDMKANNFGRRVKMRLPGGQVIYRTCGDPSEDPKKRRAGIPTNTNNWKHPGYTGAHIDKKVEAEMNDYIEEYMHEQIMQLINIAKMRQGSAVSEMLYQNFHREGGD